MLLNSQLNELSEYHANSFILSSIFRRNEILGYEAFVLSK